jgi:TusA-related sulfurtransferase
LFSGPAPGKIRASERIIDSIHTMPAQSEDSFDSNLEICYEILLYLSSRMAKLEPGGVLSFVSGDPEAPEKIPPWCDMRGYTLLDQQALAGGRTRFLIRRELPGAGL